MARRARPLYYTMVQGPWFSRQWQPLPDQTASLSPANIQAAKARFRQEVLRLAGLDGLRGAARTACIYICSQVETRGGGTRPEGIPFTRNRPKVGQVFDAITAYSWLAGELTTREQKLLINTGQTTKEDNETRGDARGDWQYRLIRVFLSPSSVSLTIIRDGDEEEPEEGFPDTTDPALWRYRLYDSPNEPVPSFSRFSGPSLIITGLEPGRGYFLQVTDERGEVEPMEEELVMPPPAPVMGEPPLLFVSCSRGARVERLSDRPASTYRPHNSEPWVRVVMPLEASSYTVLPGVVSASGEFRGTGGNTTNPATHSGQSEVSGGWTWIGTPRRYDSAGEPLPHPDGVLDYMSDADPDEEPGSSPTNDLVNLPAMGFVSERVEFGAVRWRRGTQNDTIGPLRGVWEIETTRTVGIAPNAFPAPVFGVAGAEAVFPVRPGERYGVGVFYTYTDPETGTEEQSGVAALAIVACAGATAINAPAPDGERPLFELDGGCLIINPSYLPASSIRLCGDLENEVSATIRTRGRVPDYARPVYGNGEFDVSIALKRRKQWKPEVSLDFGTKKTGIPPIDITPFLKGRR